MKLFLKNQLKQKFIKLFGLNHTKNDFNQISIYNYANNKISQNYMTNNTIAVILANGSIVSNNKSDNQNYINSNLLSKQIQKIIENPDIKALVIRLNSPGGEVGESEVIREKLEELQNSGKPIVISMGDIATSGAYYIATAGNYIIADPMTLTGSIGIFGIFNNIYQSLKLIGINIDQIDTSPFYYNILTKTMTKELKTIIKINMLHEYNQFIKIVSHSRKKNSFGN
ncbi:hypothetical protein HIC20_01890 [Buchnera aphidicola (Hormaphis cornu)]|nr:hypothetical protein HIC20_01890 [Buchnera aphidicola (Hormaphis cornu)]